MKPAAVRTSYVIAAISVPVVLWFHLLATVFAGLAVYVLTVKLAGRLPANWGSLSHKIALAGIALAVILGLFFAGLGCWMFLQGNRGMSALLAVIAETLENVRRGVPREIAEFIPTTMEDFHGQVTGMLRDHAHKISVAGMAGLKTLVHVLFGMVIGGMLALRHFDSNEPRTELCKAFLDRGHRLAEAFDRVVFAQVKISALNTLLTAIYLVILLPIFGVHLPMIRVLIPLTFVTGLLPVIGNLVSNTIIVLIGLGTSASVGVASLIFLVSIHKLEYFTNAHIVGGEVHARAWELISAMILLEAVFGLAGLVAAPVAYGWLKAELRAANMI